MSERVGNKLLIIIGAILVAFILSSFSLYRLYLHRGVFAPHAGGSRAIKEELKIAWGRTRAVIEGFR